MQSLCFPRRRCRLSTCQHTLHLAVLAGAQHRGSQPAPACRRPAHSEATCGGRCACRAPRLGTHPCPSCGPSGPQRHAQARPLARRVPRGVPLADREVRRGRQAALLGRGGVRVVGRRAAGLDRAAARRLPAARRAAALPVRATAGRCLCAAATREVPGLGRAVQRASRCGADRSGCPALQGPGTLRAPGARQDTS